MTPAMLGTACTCRVQAPSDRRVNPALSLAAGLWIWSPSTLTLNMAAAFASVSLPAAAVRQPVACRKSFAGAAGSPLHSIAAECGVAAVTSGRVLAEGHRVALRSSGWLQSCALGLAA